MAVVIQRGPVAAEAALLREVSGLLDAARADFSLLAAPVRVVVPSRALRVHVAARIVGRLGGAVAGVEVQTLRGLALEVLRRAGAVAPGGDLIFPVLVRRLASREPALRAALEELHDGYGVVAQTVGDLLDAGLEPSHGDALEEWVRERIGAALGERAGALARVALAVSRELGELGLEHGSGPLVRARRALETDAALLPARAVLLHGWADATGVASDLLAHLVRAHGAHVGLDHPPDPADPYAGEPGAAFTERLRERLGVGGEEGLLQAELPTLPELFRAPGAEAEAREVAERCARAIEAGAVPESIGIVARDLREHATPLRTHLARLGVPWSGAPGARVVPGPDAWPGNALVEVLREGGEIACDRWLDASRWLAPLRERDLRLALHALGAARLRDVTDLDLDGVLGDDASYRLPVRRGLGRARSAGEAGAEDGVSEQEADERSEQRRAGARWLPRERLEEARARARAVCERLAGWPERAELPIHLARLRTLLREELGWTPRSEAVRAWLGRLATLEAELPRRLAVTRDELALLLERASREVGRRPLGGEGGGVAVLTVTEARSRTFSHLFVLGLERDRFPRPVGEDPLLPDAARLRLCELLPDLPVKRRGFEEERYLFAQLACASPRVTFSWQAVSDDGKERAPSPLVQRILLARGMRVEDVPLVPEVLGERDAPLVPAHERAARLARARHELPEAALEVALEEVLEDPALASRVAAARVRALRELDPPPWEAWRGLGPYLGATGATPPTEIAVTRLEAIARCPWQTFLERTLRLEPLPDARIALPGLDPRVLGNVVHEVLQRVVETAGAPADAPLEACTRVLDVAWPDAATMASWLLEEAARAVRAEGIVLPGFARVLADVAADHVERVRETDWASGVRSGVLGAELRHTLPFAASDGERAVHFRADRVDREAGALLLTDYKSGKPLHEGAKKEATQRRRLLDRVARGEYLQGAAYAATAAGAVGRYLFSRPTLEESPDLRVAADDAELSGAFGRAVSGLLAAGDAGAFFPRLVDERSEVPRACSQWCAVREACAQQDTGARHRIWSWAEASRVKDPDAPVERAARDVFWLGRTPGGPAR